MDATTIAEVFALAAQSTYWKRLNIGLRTEVSHGGYSYTIDIPPSENPVPAEITYREGYGGTEFMQEFASWAQTALIVEAAMSATRLH